MNTSNSFQERFDDIEVLDTIINAEFGDLHEQIAAKQLELDLQLVDMFDKMPDDLEEDEAELLIGLATKANAKIMSEFTDSLIAARHG